MPTGARPDSSTAPGPATYTAPVDEKPTPPIDGRVSFAKRSAKPSAEPSADPAGPGRRGLLSRPNLAADGSPMPPPPPKVRYAVLALGVSAVAALVASLSLYGLKGWLLRAAVRSNNDKKAADRQSMSQLHHAVDSTLTSSLVSTLVLMLALGIAARGVWRGRYWSRWTVIALWVLATFTGTFASFTYLIGVASDEPLAFKASSFVSAAALIVAVVFVSLRPTAEYFALTRPPRPDGAAPARRGGLFGARPALPATSDPRPARGHKPTTSGNRTKPATASASATAETLERSRAKQRATTESVAKGAELARARAKASKSRRSGV